MLGLAQEAATAVNFFLQMEPFLVVGYVDLLAD